MRRYWLRVSGLSWQEATKEQYMSAERGAGFRPKFEGGLATNSFSTCSVEGKTTDGDINEADFADTPNYKLSPSK